MREGCERRHGRCGTFGRQAGWEVYCAGRRGWGGRLRGPLWKLSCEHPGHKRYWIQGARPSCVDGALRIENPKGNGIIFPKRADAAESRDAREAVLLNSHWPNHHRMGCSRDRAPGTVMHPALKNWEGIILLTPDRTRKRMLFRC